MSRHNRERKQFKALKKHLVPLTDYQKARIAKGGKQKLRHVQNVRR